MNKPPGVIIGNVDRISNGIVTGWAVSASHPTSHILLDIRVDGHIVMTVCANQPQGALGGAGQGDHGFVAVLPHHLLDAALHTVLVVDPASGTVLNCDSAAVVALSRRSPAPEPIDPQSLQTLFHEPFYRSQLAAAPPPGAPVHDPLHHYRTQGWRNGLDPHPLFDTRFYLARHGNQMLGDPLADFLASRATELRETHPLFSAAEYNRMRPDVAISGMLPLIHYTRHGWTEGHGPSRMFDHAFYHRHTLGLVAAGHEPLAHYMQQGWREERRPHPDFDPLLFHRLARLPRDTEPYTHFVRMLGTRPRTPATAQPPPTDPTPRPHVSVIIPNFNKPLLTLQCLHHLRVNTRQDDLEIIIVDNGSTADLFETLCTGVHGARILRLGANRGFGEAINIAADQATGDVLVFLNNDAYVTEGWLPPLLATLADPTVAAVGPKFMYPDGRVQECGGMILPCGASIQRGKHSDAQFSPYDAPGAAVVDYVSAACMAIRARDFHRIGGFDLCWEPAYYEDVDLCLRLRLMGLQTRYVAQSTVVHVESATWSDPAFALRSGEIVDTNRLKFATRWGAYLSGQSDGTAERHLLLDRPPAAAPAPDPALPRLGLYTPHPLTPGGGERYLLTIAHTLREHYHCTLVTAELYSRARIATLGRELGLSLNHLHLAKLGQAQRFDVFICMGNEVLPPLPGMGRLNLYHCQFPFPMHAGHYTAGWAAAATYDACIVNSGFTRIHLLREAARLNLPPIPIHVVHPPVPQVTPGLACAPTRQTDGPAIILHVGRFAPGGHCKRQDLMISAFADIVARSPRPVELHLAGAIGVDDAARSHLIALRRAARGLPITFHVNIRADQMHDLYRRAEVYWHLTGATAEIAMNPEQFEHFGITVAEAMSAGAIPIVLRHGGPSEIVVDTHSGFLIDGVPGLIERTLGVLALDASSRDALAANAIDRAARFAPAHFQAALRHILAVPIE